MAKLLVTPKGLRNAATKVEAALEEFKAATNSSRAAADNLAAMWEGDAQRAFVEEQEKTHDWFKRMEAIVETFIAFLRESAGKYEEMDAQSTSDIRAH